MNTEQPAMNPNVRKPSDNFRKAMRQILSVPKSEIQRRESEYKKARSLHGRAKTRP